LIILVFAGGFGKIDIWMIRPGGCANGNEVQWPKQKKKRGDSILDGSHEDGVR
jgi:hypothetical protein